MDFYWSHILSIVLFAPMVGAVLIAFLPRENSKAIRYTALGFSVLTFALSVPLFFSYMGTLSGFQFVEIAPWIREWGISYHIGIDGISILLVLLTTFMSILAIWFSFYVQNRIKEYMFFFLLLETGMLGVFMALDLVLFYVFWELTLIPMYFIIGIWGGANRLYAAIKFFIYTFAGSLFMLIAIVAIYYIHLNATGVSSFNLIDIQRVLANGQIAPKVELWLFIAFALAFAIKVPLFPFHTWLPDAHVEAPTAGSVLLAAVLLKMGTYGFLRFCLPLFPDASQAAVPWMMGLSVIGITYGAIVAAMQQDLKKLVAYSSVAHLGFVMLGMFALNQQGITGSVLQMVNHGISTGALFLLVGILYERTHTRSFKDFGGLKAQMPIYAALFLVIMLSSVGLPSTNGFVGEFLCLIGAFHTNFLGLYGTNLWFVVLASLGVVLAAVYLLWMYQKVFYGPNDNPKNQNLPDVKWWEGVIVASLIALVFWIGLYPKALTDKMEVSVAHVISQTTLDRGARPAWSEMTFKQMKVKKPATKLAVKENDQ
ncbi:MAG: NADH-quinone oxidoreductase subunit M [bacterium]